MVSGILCASVGREHTGQLHSPSDEQKAGRSLAARWLGECDGVLEEAPISHSLNCGIIKGWFLKNLETAYFFQYRITKPETL